MKITPVTDAILTSSTVAEADYATWAIGTTYALAERVIKSHKIYQSLQAVNLGHDPLLDTQNDPLTLPVWWVEVSATNRWQCFDGQRANQTTNANTMTYVLTTASAIDSIALLNVDAQTVNVTATFGATEIYNTTFTMTSRAISGWYDFFFAKFQKKKNILINSLPPYIGTVITVTLTRAAGNVSLGILAIGNSIYIGDAVYGAESDIRSFSKNEPNDFGVTRLVKRTPKVLTRQTVMTVKSYTSMLYSLREEIESVAAVWSTLDDANDDLFNAYVLHGIADRFVINAAYPTYTQLQLELREI